MRPPLAEKHNFWTDTRSDDVWKMDRETAEDIGRRLGHNNPRIVGYEKAIGIIEEQAGLRAEATPEPDEAPTPFRTQDVTDGPAPEM
ncbi:hypothetical protein ACEUZ9_001055 [Paracoccus litorisediminis]|uniref:hypothetical protein n=1 Tax=Paracoccus litorisediminis TaxID=2006130 RepID=UPI003734A007